MKSIYLFLIFFIAVIGRISGQASIENNQAIARLIDQYSEARENKDTVLLKNILTADIDQLVSNGEWRMGIRAAIEGMMRSSNSNPGTRSLTIDKIRYIRASSAIADCRYEIQNPDGSARKMWSTFVVVMEKGQWRISAIRNMLPAG